MHRPRASAKWLQYTCGYNIFLRCLCLVASNCDIAMALRAQADLEDGDWEGRPSQMCCAAKLEHTPPGRI